MGRYDTLIEELRTYGDPPPRWRPTVNYEDLQKSISKPGPLTAAAGALAKTLARMTASQKRTADKMAQSAALSDRAARRAHCAELNERATMLAKSGKLSAQQGALLDSALHTYAIRHRL